ncbi:hypothetical protein AB0H57_18020 [Micromonospora sp. NPDC050686]|uniref:hypothetical protein n=1 Tax=Micromonospora sp. NPDC050686 TaxID=3154631 RepID=UPI00340E8FF9
MSVLNGQVIGQAHHATRAVLERELTGLGITFHQSVALNLVAAEGGAAPRALLARRMTAALKVAEATALAALDDGIGAGLLRTLPADGSGLALTDAGRAVQQRLAGVVAALTARLYGDIAPDDLAVAGRVLTLIRQRADAELAG